MGAAFLHDTNAVRAAVTSIACCRMAPVRCQNLLS